jgi:hypothetical protein
MSNADVVSFSMDNDLWPIVFPISWAPAKTFFTTPLVAMRGGGECGYTLYGHASLELQDDAARKIHYGHFTLYAKSVVMNERMIEHRYHCHIRRYISGNDETTWDPSNRQDLADYKSRNPRKSRFVTLSHADENLGNDDMLWLTGQTPSDVDDGRAECRPEGQHGWARYWGWRNSVNLVPAVPYKTGGPKYNTLCFREYSRGALCRGFQGGVDPKGDVRTDKGHFGENYGYPGSSGIYKGTKLFLERPNFSEISSRAWAIA